VADDGQQVDVERAHVHGHLADRLRRVGVNDGADGVRGADEFGNRLEHAGFAVRMRHGDQRRVAVDCLSRLVQPHASIRVDADAGHATRMPFEPRTRLRRRRMFDHARDDVVAGLERFDCAADCEIVRFGAARCEEHFGGVAAEQRGDLFARACHGSARTRAVDVAARRIAEMLAQVRKHRIDDLGQNGCRCIVVEVDGVVVGHGRCDQNTNVSSGPECSRTVLAARSARGPLRVRRR
jgi:hypothetical protein